MPDYFTASGDPVTSSAGESSVIRQVFTDLAAGFAKVAPYTGNANKAVIINSGGTGQTVTTGTFALAGNFATTGAFNLTLALSASITVTLPATSATMARTDAAQSFAGVQTFSAQPIFSTLTASVAVFTDASKGLVSNAITGTGNVVMSASPTFTGTAAFAALSATGQFTSTLATGTAPFVVASTTEVANLKAATATLATTASAVAVGGITGLGTGVATWLATPSSANLAAAVTGETGSGALVFGTSPDITTSLTTPSTTFALVNTTATTVNFAGAATTLNMGAGAASTATLAFTTAINLNTSSVVSNQTTVAVFNATSTTVNAFGAATALNFGGNTTTWTPTTGTTITLVTATATTLNLFNSVATTLNLGGAATTIGIGAATGTLTVSNTTFSAKAGIFSTTLKVYGSQSSPTSLTAGALDVWGANATLAAGTPNVGIYTTDAVAADKGASLGLGGKNSSNTYAYAMLAGRSENSGFAGYLQIVTINAAGTANEWARVSSVGVITTLNATDASSSTVAGVAMASGLAVAKGAYIGTFLNVGTTLTVGGNAALNGSALTTTATTVTAFAGATTLLTIGGTGASAVFAIPGTLEQSTTTGALTVAGGAYIAKKLTAAGTVTPLGLLDISGASAGQIKFPATQNASADANTLDDYEEQDWTPAYAFGGAAVGVTYTTQTGKYTKIGRAIIGNLNLVITSNGSSTGDATITGFPFSAALPTPICFSCSGPTFSGTFIGILSASTITLYSHVEAGSANALTDTNIVDASTVYASFVCYV